jgi:hypothetical protein
MCLGLYSAASEIRRLVTYDGSRTLSTKKQSSAVPLAPGAVAAAVTVAPTVDVKAPEPPTAVVGGEITIRALPTPEKTRFAQHTLMLREIFAFAGVDEPSPTVVDAKQPHPKHEFHYFFNPTTVYAPDAFGALQPILITKELDRYGCIHHAFCFL